MKRMAFGIGLLTLALAISSIANGDEDKKSKSTELESVNSQRAIKPVDFKPAGHEYDVDFGVFKTHWIFKSSTDLTFIGISGKPETVTIHTVKVSDNVYLISWEETNKAKIVNVNDFENGVVYSNIVMPDGAFLRLQGRLTQTR